jgi:hypothetical protein
MARRMPPPQPMEFEWSDIGAARYAKLTTPERLAEELGRFKTPDGYKPQDIVKEAASPKSFFHKFFEWDDKKAADSYRIAQARMLIASVKVVIHDDDPEDMRRARAFYSLPRKGNSPRGYYDVETIRSDGRLQARLLDQVDKELLQIVDRHIAVKAIAPIIAEARRKLAEERAKYMGETEVRI